MKLMLFQMERSMTFEECHESKKVFEVIKVLGEELTLKLTVFVIASFQNSLKVSNGLTSSEIVMIADDFLSTYTHDSINDLIFAFRKAKYEGKEFYNKFSHQDVQAILKKYFDEKSIWIEVNERAKPFTEVAPAINHEAQKLLSAMQVEPYKSIAHEMAKEKALAMSQKYKSTPVIADETFFQYIATDIEHESVNETSQKVSN